MTLTEAEAKEKLCPYRHLRRELSDREQATDFDACYASDCMVWRWQETQEEWAKNPAGRPGYCGLAGRPE